jgi:hypothetical protein
LNAKCTRLGQAAALAVLLLSLAGARADARVFARWGTGGRTGTALRTMGGVIAYQAPITLNGGQGQLSVLSFDGGVADTAARLKPLLSAERLAPRGGSLLTTTVTQQEQVVRLVLAEVEPGKRSVVIAVDQSAQEARKSDAPRPTAAIPDVPTYPGGRPEFSATDEQTHTHFAMLAVDAEPAAAGRQMRDLLVAAGWTPALPETRASALAVFTKGAAVCMVHVSRPDDGRTRITLLHKQTVVQ